jgi:hypothetical protein
VLIDRMGNSLDRSLLLAALLSAQDHEVRLAHAKLGHDEAAVLLAEAEALLVGAPEELGATPLDDLEKLVGDSVSPERIAEMRGVQRKRGDTSYDQVERITSALTAQAAPLAAGTVEERISAERARQVTVLQEHSWVQVRLDGAWVDYDPTMAAFGRSRSAVFDTFGPDAIPAGFDHRIGITIIIETTDETGAAERITVLDEGFASASLVGQPIQLGLQPLGVPSREKLPELEGRPDEVSRIAAGLDRWLPFLEVGNQTFSTRLFYTDGETLEISGQDLNTLLLAEGMRRSVDRSVGEASGLLESLDATGDGSGALVARKRKGELSSVWLRLTMTEPGQTPRTEWRALYDAFDRPAALEPSKPDTDPAIDDAERVRRTLALTRDLRILVESARTTEAWYTRQAAQRLAPAGPALLAMAGGEVPDQERLIASADALNRADLDLLGAVSMRWSLNFGADAVFHDRPMVLLARRGAVIDRDAPAGEEPRLQYLIDIVENRVGVRLPLTEDPFLARLAQGIADTVAESAVVPTGIDAANAAVFHALDLSKGLNWRRIASTSALPGGLSPAAAAHISRDLDRGYALLSSAVGRDRTMAWWRIDPATGATLGMLENGGGSMSAEHVIALKFSLSITVCFVKMIAKAAYGTTTLRNLGTDIVCIAGAAFGTAGGTLGNVGFAISLLTSLVNAVIPPG